MPCNTCDHTMNMLVPGVFLCPRCGTVSVTFQQPSSTQPAEVETRTQDYVPRLVERVREYESGLLGDSAHMKAFGYLGISESINLPANRPEEPK